MSDSESQDGGMRSTRRGLFKGALLGLAGAVGLQSASAQTTDNEPRINLGDNFYIDDVDGSTLAVKDADSGDTLLEYVAGSGWTLTGDVSIANADIGQLLSSLDADGNDITGVGTAEAQSVYTESVDINTNRLASSGDFIGLWTAGPISQGTFSTTSTTYVSNTDQILGRAVWDTIVPATGQGAAQSLFYIDAGTGESVDVRLYNAVDGEVIQEATGLGTGLVEMGPTNYTPTTTTGAILVRIEIRTNPGSNASSLNQPYITFGVQL